MKKTKMLRKALGEGTIVVPGGFSPIVGIIAEQLGYKALYMSGYGTAAFKMGFPDVGLISLTEMVENAKNIANAVNIPVIADADTGYGNALNIRRTVREYEAAGLAGLQIEDQVWPKKCGHMEGKQLISSNEMISKVKSAVDCRQDQDFVIIARTDARTVLGFDEAITRANQYAEAGADIIFVESPLTIDELIQIPQKVTAPNLINMSEGAKTPLMTNSQLQEMGYKIILWPSSTTWISAFAIKKVLQVLLKEGTTEKLFDQMISFNEFNKLIRLDEVMALEKKYKH